MEKKLKEKNLPSCCKPTKEYKGNNPLIGIAYGIIPHIGCIMFIIGAVLGATILMQYFRPFLMNRYIFHYLILLSVGFATLSSFLYLRKNKLLSWKGIKKKKGYLAIMYGSTIGINLLLFFLVFPFLANFSLAGTVVFDGNPDNLGIMSLKSDIPCPGHAPLISNELKTIEGVVNVKYSFPNNFEVQYDKSRTSTNDMLSLEVFDEYPATLISDSKNTYMSSSSETFEYDEFTQCLTEKGIKMYGTDWCSYCQKQKDLFGSSFNYVDFVDCDKDKQECLSAGVRGYPTWKINGENYPGLQSLDKLAQLSGCELK